MKRKRSILAVLMVLVMAISSQLSVFAMSAQGAVLSPSLISAGYSVSSKTVSAGDTFNLKFTLKNTSSEMDIRNVNIRLSGGEVFAVNNDTDTIYASKIAKGAKANTTGEVPKVSGIDRLTSTSNISKAQKAKIKPIVNEPVSPMNIFRPRFTLPNTL